MYFQQVVKLKELIRQLTYVAECCFLVDSDLQEKKYHVAVYKYLSEYYLLQDDQVIEAISNIVDKTGSEEDVLSLIEEALNRNHYIIVDENLVFLDLKTLSQVDKEKHQIKSRIFEFGK
ncbi:hypothetical protein [Enterococcus sp. LJL120]